MTSNVPREIKTRATKDKVLAATARLIREKGYEYLTVRNICQESGVAYGSFYYHFGSKEELLYGFCRNRFQEMLECNPIPEWLNENNVIHTILWAYMVYAAFCEAMGKGIIGCIYMNCENDLFEELSFEHNVLDRVMESHADGYLNIIGDGSGRITRATALNNLKRDLTVLLRGAVMYWATVNDKNTVQGLGYLLEGPINRFMLSWVSHKYRESFHSRSLVVLTDLPYFEGSIKIPDWREDELS